jgi:hypothetical protein
MCCTERATNGSQRLAQFQWGSWCGTGSDMFSVPHDRALFVASLQERNYGAALAKGIAISEDRYLISPSLDDDGAWQREFITRCGFDWEMIYAGLSVQSSPYGGSSKLDALAQFGSEKSGRLLLGMAAEPSFSERADYLNALAWAVSSGERLTRTNGSGTITFTSFGLGRHWGRAPSNTFPRT